MGTVKVNVQVSKVDVKDDGTGTDQGKGKSQGTDTVAGRV